MAALQESNEHCEIANEVADSEQSDVGYVKTKKGYVKTLDNPADEYLKDYSLIIDPDTVPEKNMKAVYYEELFMTDYEIYYIILDYNISDTMLSSFLTFCECNRMLSNNSLPDDIIRPICYGLFGYYDLSFLDGVDPEYQSRVLMLKYIIDKKCKFAYFNPYYKNIKDKIIILNDTPDRDGMSEYCRDVIRSHGQTIYKIHYHYSQTTGFPKGSMFYWIKSDNLNVDTIIERGFYPPV